MINDYTKGDLVIVEYTLGGIKFCSVGIIIGISRTILTIGHNFKDISPIDITKIQVKDILTSKKIIPAEINSMNDLQSSKL